VVTHLPWLQSLARIDNPRTQQIVPGGVGYRSAKGIHMNFKNKLLNAIVDAMFTIAQAEPVSKPHNSLALYPHKLYHGYYINPKNLDVYSIKSGKLKKMKQSVWDGEIYVSLSHHGQRKPQIVRYLKSSIDYNPANSVTLSVNLS
jgi:hypothetical protein